MNFSVNKAGVITRATSGQEIVGSLVKEELELLDMVVIRRDSGDRAPKYGIYAGTFDNVDGIVRTYDGDDVVPLSRITPIHPSDMLIDSLIEKIKALVNSGVSGKYVKFFLNYLYYKYPDKYADINIPVCSICGAPFPTRNIDGQPVCDTCYRHRYITCRRCGQTVLRTNSRDGWCMSCHRRHYVLPYHHDEPMLTFHGDSHNNTIPYLGVELEVAYGGEDDRHVGEVLPLINTDDDIFMYCMHDSSLDDGFENITQPATLEYHYSMKDKYKAVFKKLRDLGYLSHDTSCCGMHVHVGRQFFSSTEEELGTLRNILLINEKFWNELLVFSRRVKQRMTYALPIDEDIDDYIADSNKSGSSTWHHYVINYANENTIEFRIFRGTLNIETFYATLELVNNIMMVCKDHYNDNNFIDSLTFDDLLIGDNIKKYWQRITSIDREQ